MLGPGYIASCIQVGCTFSHFNTNTVILVCIRGVWYKAWLTDGLVVHVLGVKAKLWVIVLHNYKHTEI